MVSGTMKNQFGGCWYWMLVCGMLVGLFCLIFMSFYIQSQHGRMIYDCQGSKHQPKNLPSNQHCRDHQKIEFGHRIEASLSTASPADTALFAGGTCVFQVRPNEHSFRMVHR